MGDIYLDSASTTPVPREVAEYAASVMGEYGNPSSIHSVGARARKIVDSARKSVSAFIRAPEDRVFFTSGGCAANTAAIDGYCRAAGAGGKRPRHYVLYSPIAHKSMLECVRKYKEAGTAEPLRVDGGGFIDLGRLEERLSEIRGSAGPAARILVALDLANSEIGTVQDGRGIARIAHAVQADVYFDCTGYAPAIPVDAAALGADMLGLSAHKIGGLKGCGALYVRDGLALAPLVYGSQEGGIFGGTENVAGIAAFGRAAEIYGYSSVPWISRCRDSVYGYLKANVPGCVLAGPSDFGRRLPHNLYVCFDGIDGETLMLLLDGQWRIQVSTGSACSAGGAEASPALSATGVPESLVHSGIRMTFGGGLDGGALDYVCDAIRICVARLRNMDAEWPGTLGRDAGGPYGA